MCGNLLAMLWESRSKLGDAQGGWFQLMPQFQPEVPDPLRDQLPAFLTPGGMAAPAVGILLVVFIRQCRLKGAAMQIQFDDIDRGECPLWQLGEEKFVDDPRTRDANGALLFPSWMSCDDYTAQHTFRPHRDRRRSRRGCARVYFAVRC